MEKRPHYAAFLSHRSADKEFVFWLQKKLEHYSVGRKIRERYDLRAKTVSPLCVDSYEFTSNELKKEIAQKLDDSEKMILICSFSSANPVPGRLDWSADPSAVEDWSADPSATGWVGYEIDYMLKSGRQADIIPVVIEGDPEAGDCFHPLVKDLVRNDLLYYDFRKFKKTDRLTFLKLVGSTLAIDNLGEIFDHDAKRKRIQRISAAAAVLALAAAGIWAWSYFLPHTKNYSDYVMVNGLPEGLGELSRSQMSGTAEHYTITTTKASHRIELSHVNSAETPVEDENISRPDSPMIAVYQCRSNWSPDTVEYRDRNGIVQMTWAYATDMRFVTFQENEYTSDQVYPSTEVDEYGVPIRMKIDRYDLTYDEAGRLVRRMYMSGVNYVIDDTGAAGEQYTYDEAGRITSLRYLSRDIAVINNQHGFAGYDYVYNSDGRLESSTTVNAAGVPVYGTDWYSIVRYTYSGMGQIVEGVYYTPEGKETVCSGGYSRVTREYDTAGNRICEYFSGPDESPLYCSGKYHLARYTYNGLGDMTSAAYFDDKDSPAIISEGYSSIAWERDEKGNPTRTEYFSTGGDPMPSQNYAAVTERVYNSAGYMIDEKNYGPNGNPVITADGYFRRTVDCDEKGRPLDITVYGFEDNRVYHSDGWSRMHFDYDDRGNLGTITLYGTSDRLLAFAGHWAVQQRTYNGGGQVTSVSYTDQFGKPVVASSMYASVENTYDDRGLLTSTAYYDAGGKLKKGTVVFDFGATIGDHTFAKVEYEYDDAGNEILRRQYGEDGQLTADVTPIIETEYDEVGHPVKYLYRNAEGELTGQYEACRELSYDEFGRLISTSNYDKNGKPVNGVGGYFTRYQPKDFRGNILEHTDTDKNGKIVGSRTVYEYDERGLNTVQSTVDADGSPAVNRNGYSTLKIEYDYAGRQVRATSCDTSGAPVLAASGFCTIELEYDSAGLITSAGYYGTDGEPVDLKTGHHGYTQEYNDYRMLTKTEYFDKDDTVLFRYEASYKDYIYPTDEALYGRNGEPIGSKGYNIWRVRAEYDENGQKTSTYYYDKDGELTLLIYMFAGWSSEYDKGLEVGRTYYGTDGDPMMIDTGFASVKLERNDLGQEVRRTYYDENGNPVNNAFGFSVMEVTYGGDGELNGSAFYDTAGRAVTPDGEAVLETMILHGEGHTEEIYDPETGEPQTVYFSSEGYNVRILAFRASDGTYDQFAQPNYILFNPGEIGDYLYMSASSYIPEISEDDDSIDVSGNENAEGWKQTIDAYVQALEEGDVRHMAGLMDLSSVSGAVEQLNALTNTPHTAEELTEFYFDYWKEVMDETWDRLDAAYGEDFQISYEYLDVMEYGDEDVAYVNNSMKQLTGTAGEYTGIVSLTMRYTVTGSKASGMETEGYFTPALVLFQTADGWTLGTGNGFPRPDTQSLVDFFGGYRR